MLNEILAKVEAKQPINEKQALFLHEKVDLITLGQLADQVRWQLHPQPIVTYIIDRNINPTNICITDCSFCAFYRRPNDDKEGYILPREVIYQKIEELISVGGSLVLLQGGHHPYLKTEWYESLLADLRERYPNIHLHALSPPEIHHLSRLDKIPVKQVIERLKAAGLQSIPGGGAEILVDRVRQRISPKKTNSDTWLQVMREAHELGLRTTATMMYGHVETVAERIAHLQRLRDLQTQTGGFTAFACWNFQKENTQLDVETTTPAEYLRVVAVARIYLHNIPNFQASYVTQGIKTAQISLRYGVNDFGGSMLEENVVSKAGCFELVQLTEIERAIKQAGFTPQQRNFFYEQTSPLTNESKHLTLR